MAVLLKVDGSRSEVLPTDGKKFTPDEYFKLLGCQTTEFINLWSPRRVLVVDFDARLTQQGQSNLLASHEYGGHIYRDALLCSESEVD